MYKTKSLFFILVTLGFGGDFFSDLKLKHLTNTVASEFDLMIGIRVEFLEESPDYSGTSGNGRFLNEIPGQVFNRCDGFLVDKPNHDEGYFLSQMKAVRNYFEIVSNHNFTYEYLLLDSIFTVTMSMKEYADSDMTLGALFFEAVTLSENEIINTIESHYGEFTELNLQNSLITIFHAGIGQDFAVPFLDPTPHDLPSAYIESSMLAEIPSINGIFVDHGLLLPETENHIYYDGIEDMFWGETEFCDYQVGLTGIFSFLVGYAIGLPPMYNTDTGETGIGVFGLMDHGSNNGRGVIPSPPDAWSRILMGWTTPDLLNDFDEYDISPRHLADEIYKIPISENEYFLIENRANHISGNTDITDLIWEDPYSPSNWFDVVQEIIDTSGINHFSLNESYNIFESVENYDIGLPGSGLLIWHITEPAEITDTLNNDPENRVVHLEEADGAVDLGFENYNPFYDEHMRGWQYDMWYKGNSYWDLFNPNYNGIEFSNGTVPNTKSSVGSQSNIRISQIDSDGGMGYFHFSKDSDMDWIEITGEENLPIGGGDVNGTGYVFYRSYNSIYQISYWDTIAHDLGSTNLPNSTNLLVLVSSNNVFEGECDQDLPAGDGWCIVTSLQNNNPLGYVDTFNVASEIDTAIALGDIDLDGLDEIFFIKQNFLNCINSNGSSANGFPVELSNPLSILVANINNDPHPEIILKDGNDLVILSHDGNEILRETSIQNSEPMIVPKWNGENAALVDANHVHLFPFDISHTYWPMPYGQANGNSISSGNHFQFVSDVDGIPEAKVYNYPNPIIDGETTFRFYIGNSFNPDGGTPTQVKINIYNASGRFVESLKKIDLTLNDYNEIKWRPENLNAGVYLAEVAPNVGQSHLVHVLYLK